MTYGIDVNALTREHYTGVERYVFELLTHMKQTPLREGERMFLYASRTVPALEPLPAGWHWRILRMPFGWKGWTHIRLSIELLFHPPEVFFSPAHEIPMGAMRTTVVNTIHDIAFVHVPQAYTYFARLRQRWALERAMRLSKRIFTVSQTTFDDLHRVCHVAPHRMRVTRLGFGVSCVENDSQDVLRRYGLTPKQYIFTLGRIEKKKGLHLFLEAFEAYVDMHPDDGLVWALAGKAGTGEKALEEKLASSRARHRIIRLGFVPQEDICVLLRNTRAFVFPSLYEGFGMPVLEAMSAGAPVIASNIPAMQEVCAQSALLLDPYERREWTRALEDMGHESFAGMYCQKGKERVRAFSWQMTAQSTWKALREVADLVKDPYEGTGGRS